MNKLFIHTPVFRFLSPFFGGTVAYLLILLINNNIGQLQEEFLSQELYVCIALSFIVHEFSRFLLWLFKFIPNFFSTAFMLLIYIVISLLVSGYFFSNIEEPYSIGYINILGFLIFTPITILLAPIGAKFSSKIKKKLLNKIFGIVLMIISLRSFYEIFDFI